MSEKFTPGPWHLVNDEICQNIVGDGRRVAIIGQRIMFYDDEDQTEGNAHLISAAPEMYEALDRISRRIQAGTLDEWSWQALVDLAERTLKKARGEL